MGFKEIFKSGIDYISEKNNQMREEYNKYREMYSNRDDQTLKRLYNSALGTKRMALASLLRERGYGSDDI